MEWLRGKERAFASAAFAAVQRPTTPTMAMSQNDVSTSTASNTTSLIGRILLRR
jgi:hypothetical protein